MVLGEEVTTIGNNDCCYGNNEVDCNLTDLASFKRLVSKLPKNSNVYTSKLSRAVKTFDEVVKNGFKYNKYFKDGRLSEQNLGDYTGMKYEELYNLTKRLGIYDPNWLMCPTHVPPNGESYKDRG